MEVGQGPNWGCSAKGGEKIVTISSSIEASCPPTPRPQQMTLSQKFLRRTSQCPSAEYFFHVPRSLTVSVLSREVANLQLEYAF
jgi:hypothetical protein